jgi:hypothetical protein
MAFTINGSTGLTFPDGTVQAVAAGLVNVQTFNASGTWTKPASGSMARIQVWAGGSGGSRSSSGTSGGAGGVGGGYSELTVPLSTLGATVTVTIGAGGTGRTATAGTGTDGGTTTFGSLVGALGGLNVQGVGGAPFVPPSGLGAYLDGGVGVCIFNGGYSGTGLGASLFAGGGGSNGSNTAGGSSQAGGVSIYGGAGGRGAGNNTVAVAGTQPAGGGGGGYGTGTYANGADGGAGRVVVTVW